MNKNMENMLMEEYHFWKTNCLYSNDPTSILGLSSKPTLAQLQYSFRTKATLLHDIELIGSFEESELAILWEHLVDAYNRLDQEHFHSNNQINTSDAKNLVRFMPMSYTRNLDATFVAIAVSFLIAFETVFLVLTTGDSRLSIYLLNAACLTLVASVELFLWNRRAYRPSDAVEAAWNEFFLDPKGRKKEILSKPYEQWTKEDFEYLVLSNQESYEDYKNHTLTQDQMIYVAFCQSVKSQYTALKRQNDRDSLENHSFYKLHDLHKKWFEFLQEEENLYRIWGKIRSSDLELLLNDVPQEHRHETREALYRLFHYSHIKGN